MEVILVLLVVILVLLMIYTIIDAVRSNIIRQWLKAWVEVHRRIVERYSDVMDADGPLQIELLNRLARLERRAFNKAMEAYRRL